MKITIDNKCPSCGANVKFNPTTQKWDCEYCGNSYEIGEFEKQQEKETKENLDFEIDEYTCPNCGATVVTDANTVATHCVYCGNTTIMKNRLQGEFKPDKLIPFKTTKEEAIEEANWVINKLKGYSINYPVAIDIERSTKPNGSGRADELDKNTRTYLAKTFCQTIQSSGYTPCLLYTSPSPRD